MGKIHLASAEFRFFFIKNQIKLDGTFRNNPGKNRNQNNCYNINFTKRHFFLNFKNSNINLPFKVVRYCCLGLVGLLGIVIVSQLRATKGCI